MKRKPKVKPLPSLYVLSRFLGKYRVEFSVIFIFFLISIVLAVTYLDLNQSSELEVNGIEQPIITVKIEPTASHFPPTEKPRSVPTRVFTKTPSPTPSPACTLPDESLKATWEENQKVIDEMRVRMDAQVAELNTMYTSDPDYEPKRQAHTSLLYQSYGVGRTLTEAKNTYTSQLDAYNSCMLTN